MEKRLAVVVAATLIAAGGARAQQPATAPGRMHQHGGDTAFAGMQARGKTVMGVDQYASVHHFDSLPDGGRIELQASGDDTAAVRAIRRHLRGIAHAFAGGDFSSPALVHAQQVPGARVMAARRRWLRYTYGDVPRGGAVRIVTRDSSALAAVHEFLAFQRREHHAGGMVMPGRD
jgi:hypothetical protein